MLDTTNIDQMRTCTELQIFDRKSARIDAKALAITIIAFANADGGDIAIGLEDDGTVTGIDGAQQHINELLRAPFDFCVPSVEVETTLIDCVDHIGASNHVLMMHISPSSQLHANQADEVYYRVGDKSKKMNFEQRTRLMYAKGHYFEDAPVYKATIDDIDLVRVQKYLDKIGYTKTPEEYLRANKDFVGLQNGKDVVSGAAILLFGKNSQRFFPRARVRFIRYEGTEAKVGTEMNVVKDVVFEGTILDMVEQSTAFVEGQMREYSFLGQDGRFVTVPEYPKFCWTELIVNAIGHRDYSIAGTDIQIKMFDDHFTVESPGTLPGLVRTGNIREIHFSRNPKIFEVLHTYEYVKEFGEGVDRMFREMESATLPAPVYHAVEFMLYATIYNSKGFEMQEIARLGGLTPQVDPPSRLPKLTPQVEQVKDDVIDSEMAGEIIAFCAVPRTQNEILEHLGLTDRKHMRKKYLSPLLAAEKLKMTIPDKPNSKLQKYVSV